MSQRSLSHYGVSDRTGPARYEGGADHGVDAGYGDLDAGYDAVRDDARHDHARHAARHADYSDYSAPRHAVEALNEPYCDDRYPVDNRPTRDGRMAGRRGLPGQDYTLGHAGRQVRIGPIAFWICVGTLVIMAGWSAITATYFAFHDDVLARLIARQAAMQFAYEDRIAEMRAQVDRVTSRQLLDQEQFERRLDQIAKRQSALEARSSSLGALSDPAVTGSIRPATRGLSAREPATAPPKPSPMSTTVMPYAPTDRGAMLDPDALSANQRGNVAMNGGVEGTISRLQNSLDRVEARQTASLNSLEESYDSKVKRMRGVLAELGLRHAPHGIVDAPTGGPFVPYRLASAPSAFDGQVNRVALARVQADKLARAMAALPIRKPVTGEIDTTSSFGVRMDPFLNRPAMHTGIDFRGTTGEAIRVTASGTVTAAGWSGGYGRMVEIDHGNGLSTRYGHLSEIDVTIGQSVKIGQVIGRMGSTGRSTGPHLHYETRIDGEPVDPERFLRAGVRMGAIQ
jgi:murein DD-endopeptidase MepM/ murein hydrolase activator NlpD